MANIAIEASKKRKTERKTVTSKYRQPLNWQWNNWWPFSCGVMSTQCSIQCHCRTMQIQISICKKRKRLFGKMRCYPDHLCHTRCWRIRALKLCHPYHMDKMHCYGDMCHFWSQKSRPVTRPALAAVIDLFRYSMLTSLYCFPCCNFHSSPHYLSAFLSVSSSHTLPSVWYPSCRLLAAVTVAVSAVYSLLMFASSFFCSFVRWCCCFSCSLFDITDVYRR